MYFSLNIVQCTRILSSSAFAFIYMNVTMHPECADVVLDVVGLKWLIIALLDDVLDLYRNFIEKKG